MLKSFFNRCNIFLKSLSAKQCINALLSPQVLTPAIMLIIMVILLFLPPYRGVADNGDFARMLVPYGFHQPDVPLFYDYYVPIYTYSAYEGLPIEIPPVLQSLSLTLFYFIAPFFRVQEIYAVSQNIIVTIGICLSSLFHESGIFDLRYMAGVYMALLLFSVYLIILSLKSQNRILTLLLCILTLFGLGDSTQTIYFNSFYGEACSYVSLLAMAAFGLCHIKSGSRRSLIWLFIFAYMFFGSKMQYTLLSFLIALFLIPVWLRDRKHTVTMLLGYFLLLLITIGIYTSAPGHLERDTMYNSVFYGVLKNSTTPSQDLVALGLSPELAVLAGTNAYDVDLPIDTKSTAFDELFYDRISRQSVLKFYLSRPARLYEKMEITAQNAFDNKVGMMGNYTKEDAAYKRELNSFFTLHNTIKSLLLPRSFIFLVLYYLIYFIVLFLQFIKKDARKREYISLLFFIMLIGILQYPLPALGNGEADMGKQLFIFNLSFDISFAVILYFTTGAILRKFFKQK